MLNVPPDLLFATWTLKHCSFWEKVLEQKARAQISILKIMYYSFMGKRHMLIGSTGTSVVSLILHPGGSFGVCLLGLCLVHKGQYDLEMLSQLPPRTECWHLAWECSEGPQKTALTLLISCGTCELVSFSLEIELWHSPPITAINVLKFCSWWSFCDTEQMKVTIHVSYKGEPRDFAASLLTPKTSEQVL